MSRYEERIVSILRAECIPFTREKIFPNLNYKGCPLRYDFYISNKGKNFCIEVDGEQHFKDTKYFKNFKHMQENDRRKNRYCLQNNIPLFRIPYWDINSIVNIDSMLRPQYRVTSIYHNDRLIRERKSKGLL